MISSCGNFYVLILKIQWDLEVLNDILSLKHDNWYLKNCRNISACIERYFGKNWQFFCYQLNQSIHILYHSAFYFIAVTFFAKKLQPMIYSIHYCHMQYFVIQILNCKIWKSFENNLFISVIIRVNKWKKKLLPKFQVNWKKSRIPRKSHSYHCECLFENDTKQTKRTALIIVYVFPRQYNIEYSKYALL